MHDRSIDVCFVFFRSLRIAHLEAALYSLSRQNLTDVRQIRFLDNNTDFTFTDIASVLPKFFRPDGSEVPVDFESLKHQDETKTQSWSVNHVCRDMCPDDVFLFFTRADYILDFDCLSAFTEALAQDGYGLRSTFVTSWAYHMAYDERGDQRIDAFRDIEVHGWRHKGAQVLLDAVNGWQVQSSHTDAGVWLTHRRVLERAGWMDERLWKSGYQPTEFQKRIRERGTTILEIPRYLFFHQHHAAPRSYDEAKAQLAEAGTSVEELAQFRPDVVHHAGAVCDELDVKK